MNKLTDYKPQAAGSIYDYAHVITKNLEGRFLDCGAGAGNFSRVLRGQNKDTHACDLHPESFKIKGIECRFSDLNKKINYPKNFFDNVVCLEVIEHLENPWALVRGIKRVLKNKGKLLISTPNIESINSIASFIFTGKHSCCRGLSDPTHISPISEGTLTRILKENGFSIKSVVYTGSLNIPVISHLLSLYWQNFGLTNHKRFSSNLILLAEKQK